MTEQIQTDFPIWLVSIGLILAIFLSLWSYSGNRNEDLFTNSRRYLLIVLRGLGFFLVFVLFIGFLWKKQSTVKQKPIYVIAVDNSQSMLIGQDSMNLVTNVNDLIKSVNEKLGDRFEVHKLEFGTQVSAHEELSFSEQTTNFGLLFSHLNNTYFKQAVKELLLITDGISTAGQNLKGAQSKWPFPISVLAVGDSSKSIDLRIGEVLVNDLVYLNSMFSIDVVVQAEESNQEQVSIELRHHDEFVADTMINLDPVDGKGRTSFLVEATEIGNQVYTLAVEPLSNEVNEYNNSKTIALEVIEQKHQAIILYHTANPDIRFFEETLEESGKFDLTSWPISKGMPDFDAYQLAIVYQLPTNQVNDEAIFAGLIQSGINALMVVGPETSLIELEQHLDIISFPANRQVGEDFGGRLNEQFNLFIFPDNLSEFLSEMPPLRAPLSGISMKTPSSNFVTQIIKDIDLNVPLIWFARNGSSKLCFWWGEGLWRWNMYEYLKFGEHYFTRNMTSSILNYLTINDITDPLKIDVPGSISSFEKLTWKASLYNESFEMINYPDLFMDLILPDGETRKLEFRKLDGKYWLDQDQLIPGQYIYHCYTTLSNTEIRKSGVVQVLETALENLDSQARFSDLQIVSKQKGGRFFPLSQKSDFIDSLDEVEAGETASFKESQWVNLLNWQLFLFFIIILFSLEWLLRRWSGTR